MDIAKNCRLTQLGAGTLVWRDVPSGLGLSSRLLIATFGTPLQNTGIFPYK